MINRGRLIYVTILNYI